MERTIHDIQKEIDSVVSDIETMKANYARPYLQGFKKRYLWTTPTTEAMYHNAQNKLASLVYEKRQLEKEKH